MITVKHLLMRNLIIFCFLLFANCSIIEEIEDQIIELPEMFKGKLHWHNYSEEQIKATEQWIRYVGDRDQVDVRLGLKQFIKKYGPTKGFDFQEDAYYGKVKGLLVHGNVRRGKSDCYPHPDLVDMILSL